MFFSSEKFSLVLFPSAGTKPAGLEKLQKVVFCDPIPDWLNDTMVTNVAKFDQGPNDAVTADAAETGTIVL